MHRILGTTDLIGRDAEVERIVAHVAANNSLVILAQPGCGTTEILRHVCDRVAAGQDALTPFYFEAGPNGLDREVLTSQLVTNSLVVLDAAHNVDRETLRAITATFARRDIPFIVAGRRRALFAALAVPAMRLERLPFAETVRVVEQIATRVGLAVSDACRDLIALLLGGRARMITSFMRTAAERTDSLDSFMAVQQIFGDEMLGGRIAREIDAEIEAAVPNSRQREQVLKLFNEEVKVSVSDLEASGIDAASIARLHELELINIDRGIARSNREDHAFNAYIRARSDVVSPRGLIAAKEMAAHVASSKSLMTAHYRSRSVLGLRETLSQSNGQSISRRTLDFGAFRESLKGLDDDVIIEQLNADDDRLELPRVFYTVEAEHVYPPLEELIEKDRGALALGTDSSGDQLAIFAAEIESKLEATRETAEFWCDRLEMAAVSCEFANYRIWLVAPEGFDDDALLLLAERNAYGSSFTQARLLRTILEAPAPDERPAEGDLHEFVVPMGEAGELLAAKVVEDLAERYGIPTKPANQIKTALVEALINAAEHSLSPERIVHLRFATTTDTLTITVSNRGLRLSDKTPSTSGGARRGWGLKVIEKLMDGVGVEETDDGTRLVMSKRFTAR